MKKLVTIISFCVALIWVYQFYVGGLNYVLDPSSDKRVVLDIKKGSSADAIADELYVRKLIQSPAIFKFYLKQHDLASQLKAGRIVLQENFSLKQIADALIEGGSNEVVVTLLEGWTIEQMAEYLEKNDLTTAESFLDCVKNCVFDFNFLPDGYLEGYLYPDTYFVDPAAFDDQAFITRLISTLESRLTDEDWQAVKDSGYSFEQIMIMASIIEREERVKAEQPTIAGILWDRFDNAVGLGADATVLYALGRTKGGLSYQDLQVDSPYNTRKYRGLPPTPIANPNISSIRAAIYPKRTDYFYYLHDAEGEVHYAETLDEHNENKRKYL